MRYREYNEDPSSYGRSIFLSRILPCWLRSASSSSRCVYDRVRIVDLYWKKLVGNSIVVLSQCFSKDCSFGFDQFMPVVCSVPQPGETDMYVTN